MARYFLSIAACALLGFPVSAARANLLLNAGFDGGTGVVASSWSCFDSGGREPWAARNGAAGFSLYGWASNGWGGVWQDVVGQTGNTWYAFTVHARAWCFAEAGDFQAATGHVVQARGLVSRHPMSGSRYSNCE